MTSRHRIAWKSKVTGYSGHGEWHPVDDIVDGKRWADMLNEAFPDIHHWIETEPSWTEVDTSCEDTEIV